ncbi:hypothetical protein GCM10020331_085890 [Ectobacillus funiculus]
MIRKKVCLHPARPYILLASHYLLLFFLLLVPYITPYDPVHINMGERLKGISVEHLLGTDHLGRDVFHVFWQVPK